MQDLQIELKRERKNLAVAITELKKRGIDKSEAEKNYRIALSKEILAQRDAGMPVTIISDICRGNKDIAKLKFDRDVSETLYECAQQYIYACKMNMGIIERQIEAERRGE